MSKTKKGAAQAPDAATAPAGDSNPTDKKKRTANPGVRIQGGRIYDSENGTTCHQCRQKTAEVKAKCSKCTLYFCPKCLENRYGELVEEVNQCEGWSCPRCRQLCNCSNCRKKKGLEATGQLAGISRTAGFGSVCDLLAKNPKARALQLAASKAGQPGAGTTAGKAQPVRGAEVPKKRRRVAEADLVEEGLLGERPYAMPAPLGLALYKAGNSKGAKRQRGPAWLSSVPSVTTLVDGVQAGELASLLEFVQVFAHPLKLRIPSLPALAAELLQPPPAAAHPGSSPPTLLCPSPDDSLVAHLHMRLIDVVREAWGLPTASSPSTWQRIMLGYFREALANRRGEAGEGRRPGVSQERSAGRGAGSFQAACAASGGGGDEPGRREPPAIAGTELQGEGGGGGRGQQGEEGEKGQEAAPGPHVAGLSYPRGGYWGVDPGLRVSMLYALSHDALDTYTLRDYIDACMGNAEAEKKERKTELAEVRKETREAAAQQRNKEIALLIAHATGEGISAEQQRQLVEEARLRAETAAAEKAAARLTALQVAVFPPAVRGTALGEDREGSRLYRLQTAGVLAGCDGLLAQRAQEEGGAGPAREEWCSFPAASLPALAAAMDPRGRREGPLRHALISSCKLSLKDVDAMAAATPQSDAGTAKKVVATANKRGKRDAAAAKKASPVQSKARADAKKAARERAAYATQDATAAAAVPAQHAAALAGGGGAAPAKKAAARRGKGLPLKVDDILVGRG